MIRNLTPHPVTCNGRTFPSEGSVRVNQKVNPMDDVEGLPTVKNEYGMPVFPEGIKLNDEDVLIVSTIAANALQLTGDCNYTILVPDTGPDSVLRDSSGNIVGVKRFIRIN